MKHTKSMHRGGIEKEKNKKKSIFILGIQVYQIIIVILCTVSKALSMLASIQQSIHVVKETCCPLNLGERLKKSHI